MDITTLREAVTRLELHISSGGKMPEGPRGSCLSCPVAKYLSREVGADVVVDGHEVWYADGTPRNNVPLPENVVAWIDEFDEEDWNFDEGE